VIDPQETFELHCAIVRFVIGKAAAATPSRLRGDDDRLSLEDSGDRLANL
jgi:hypothetical protein